MTEEFKFEIIKADSATRARVGKLTTPHGVINTPHFMPVGTQATYRQAWLDDQGQYLAMTDDGMPILELPPGSYYLGISADPLKTSTLSPPR